MRLRLYLVFIVVLFSCDEPIVQKAPIDKLAYEFCATLKKTIKKNLRTIFRQTQ